MNARTLHGRMFKEFKRIQVVRVQSGLLSDFVAVDACFVV